MFLLIICLTGCQKINSEDEGVKQEQDIVEKITEAEDLDVIGETESSAAYVNEAERVTIHSRFDGTTNKAEL